MRIEPPYSPLDKKNLGISVADALLAQPLGPLPPHESFIGAGVYAIYYSGDFPAYAPIMLQHDGDKGDVPIYVGKAIPRGGRKGSKADLPVGTVLYDRLAEHADSIRVARNLNLSDFSCRYLTVDDIWIPLGESLLIQMFSPVWNLILDGFGNHDPGAGRYEGQATRWDVVHPGRGWASKLKKPNTRSNDELVALIQQHFINYPHSH